MLLLLLKNNLEKFRCTRNIYNNFLLLRFMYNKIVFREYKNEKGIFYDNGIEHIINNFCKIKK